MTDEPTREQVLAMDDKEFAQALIARSAASRKASAERIKAANQRSLEQKYGPK